MKRIFLLATIACFAASLVWAGEPATTNARCSTCAPLTEGLQKDLPQLFGEGAAFAAAGDNLSVWSPTEGVLKANPNSDLSLNNGGLGGGPTGPATPPTVPTTPTIPVPHGGGCFVGGTLITMADGSQKAIETLKAGDIVLAYDEKTGTMKPDAVKKTLYHPKDNTYVVINGSLKVTPNHPILSKGKWTHVYKLKVGDTLTNAKGEDVAIFEIVKVKKIVDVYNFEVNPYHTYVAGGFIVHNATSVPPATQGPGKEDPPANY